MTYNQLIYSLIFCLRSIQLIYMSFLRQRHAIPGLSDFSQHFNILCSYISKAQQNTNVYLCFGVIVSRCVCGATLEMIWNGWFDIKMTDGNNGRSLCIHICMHVCFVDSLIINKVNRISEILNIYYLYRKIKKERERERKGDIWWRNYILIVWNGLNGLVAVHCGCIKSFVYIVNNAYINSST